MYVRTYIHMYVCTYVRMYACTYVPTYTYVKLYYIGHCAIQCLRAYSETHLISGTGTGPNSTSNSTVQEFPCNLYVTRGLSTSNVFEFMVVFE